MKKATIKTVVDFLNEWIEENGAEFTRDELIEARDEMVAELSKGEAEKAKNAEAYESIHALIVDTLSDTPATVAEIWESIENDVPKDITKSKVQYALNNLWQDEIVKIAGKPNTYRRA